MSSNSIETTNVDTENPVHTGNNPINNSGLLEIETGIIQSLPPIIDSSITERFIRRVELRLMRTLPVVTDHTSGVVTMITTEGLFQLNQETRLMKCILNTNQLEKLNLPYFSTYFETVPDEGILISTVFSLSQLNALERSVISLGGRGIMGYTINERSFLLVLGYIFFYKSQYPPLPNSYARRWLETLDVPLTQDVMLAFRVVIFAFILYMALPELFLGADAVDNFFIINDPWVSISGLASLIICLFLLNSRYFSRETMFSKLDCIRRIEKSMISLLGLFSIVLMDLEFVEKTCFLLFLLLIAIKFGSDSKDSLYSAETLNIFHRTNSKTLFYSFLYATRASSFFTLGVDRFLSASVYYSGARVSLYNDLVYTLQFSVFVLTFFIHLSRHPYFSPSTQINGRHIGNACNALANVFLMNFAYTELMSAVEIDIVFFSTSSLSLSSEIMCFYIWFLCNPLIFSLSFCTVFPTINDLPELSIEPAPPEKPWYEAISERIEPMTRTLQYSRSIHVISMFRPRVSTPISDNLLVDNPEVGLHERSGTNVTY